MPRQLKDGSCVCWHELDRVLAVNGSKLEKMYGMDGIERLIIATYVFDEQSLSVRIYAKFCPFCGAKLKEPVAMTNAPGGE